MENLTLNNVNALFKNLLKEFHTLLDCPVRFGGEYGEEKIQHFLEYVESYKRIKCIADEQALQELDYLLTEHAYTWWIRRKCHIATWSEALAVLQNQYAKQRSPYIIFKDLFQHAHKEYTSEEDFIHDKYELLMELPEPKPSVKTRLDIICALLPAQKQSKLEYSKITTLVELKDELFKLNCNQNMLNGQQNGGHIIETQNKENEANAVNDQDPIIKVRCTADLMPHVKKEEESEERITDTEEEFVSTKHISKNNERNFQIDSDIMNQINNIIDESERHCIRKVDHLQISPKEIPSAALELLIKGETTIQAEVSKKNHPAVRATNTVNETTTKKLRCGYCRKYNHTTPMCFRKARKRLELLTENLTKNRDSSDCPKEVGAQDVSNDEVGENATIDNTASEPPLTIVEPLSIPIGCTISQATQEMFTSEPSTLSISNTSLALVLPTISHITTLTSTASTLSSNSFLTTKLIAPISGPSLKQSAAKLRNNNGPSPKCHQCGAVGFYKSICPNCSPIYNTNQYK